MARTKKPSDYAARCTKCQAKTEHYSGLCKSCRANKCKRCERPIRAKVNQQEICRDCRARQAKHNWQPEEYGSLVYLGS